MQRMFEQTHSLLGSTLLCDFVKQLNLLEGPRKPSNEVIKLQNQQTVADAIRTLANYGILSSPVFDFSTEDYIGLLDAGDLLRGLLKQVSGPFHELQEEEYIQRHHRLSMVELQSLGLEYGKTKLQGLLHHGELWFKGDSSSTLTSLIKTGFRVNNTPKPQDAPYSKRVHHRVAVFEILPGESTPDGPIPQWRITDIVSQMDVLRFLLTVQNSDLGWSKSLEELGLIQGEEQIVTVKADVPALVAFTVMQKVGLSGLAILDESGKLCGSLSVSDLRGLTPERFGALALPVGAFLLLQSPAGGLGWDDALLGKHPTKEWGTALQSLQVLTCTVETSLKEAISLMVLNRKHRVYVQNGEELVGVITPTDVLRTVLNK